VTRFAKRLRQTLLKGINNSLVCLLNLALKHHVTLISKFIKSLTQITCTYCFESYSLKEIGIKENFRYKKPKISLKNLNTKTKVECQEENKNKT
jgi:hypothetical protein